MITGIGFVGIVTENREMRAFYRDVLGLELLAEHSDRFAYFATDARGRVELLAPHTNLAQHQHPHRVSFGLLVEDLDAALAELESKPTGPVSEVFSWTKGEVSQRWVFLRDPDGNALLLLEQRGDELAMRRGHNTTRQRSG